MCQFAELRAHPSLRTGSATSGRSSGRYTSVSIMFSPSGNLSPDALVPLSASHTLFLESTVMDFLGRSRSLCKSHSFIYINAQGRAPSMTHNIYAHSIMLWMCKPFVLLLWEMRLGAGEGENKGERGGGERQRIFPSLLV